MMIWLIGFLFMQLVAICFGGGVLKLSFSQFSHNLQCDYLSQCDFKFILCVDHANSSVNDFHEECKYLREEVRELNSVSLHFKQWPGNVLLKIVILDLDLFENDLMDYMYTLLNNKPGEKKQIELKNKTRLIVTSELMCDFEYFGLNCSVFCSQRDDSTGHFKCNRRTGEIICLKGWGGPTCNYLYAISTANGNNKNKPPLPTPIKPLNDIVTTVLPTLVLSDDPNILVNEIGDEILSGIQISFDNETEDTTTIFESTLTQENTLIEYETEENSTIVESVTEIQFFKENAVVTEWNSNYSNETVTFSFHLNDTSENVSKLSTDSLQYSFQTVLKRYIAEDIDYMKVNVTIVNESLQIIITVMLDVNNQTILQRVLTSIAQEKSNIENSFIKEAFTKGHHIHTIRPTSKSVPEWAIILVVVAVVLIVLITMRQSHKYCVSKNLMKPKELNEEPDGELGHATALNFTNPIYSRPKN